MTPTTDPFPRHDDTALLLRCDLQRWASERDALRARVAKLEAVLVAAKLTKDAAPCDCALCNAVDAAESTP